MKRKISRKLFVLGTLAVLAAALAYAFKPSPMEVDMGEVVRKPMTLTIDEEGRARVREAYEVFAPVDGRLLRVEVEPGEGVSGGRSVVARMLPSVPMPLDIRDESRASADLAAAEAALRLARSDRERAVADRDLAQVQLRRIRRLRGSGAASQLQLDQAEREARTTAAALHNADAAIAVRKAERAGALSRLRRFGSGAGGAGANVIPILAPADGRVLRVLRESEGPLAAGTLLMEVGDVEAGLEVVAELLSSEAVRVSPGDRAVLSGWGGEGLLNGVVEKIEPFAFTKVSALGVEEQRVNVIVRLSDPPEAFRKLGHGFRVEVGIVVWEDPDALTVPSSALFRNGGDWTVFVVEDGAVGLRSVEVGRNNGVDAQVLDGLRPGERVVLYPSSDLADGMRVTRRAPH
ncbi:efflux RND transporter periplasmic adaptor subunit [Fretibacterium sp. OH1220_COT-178]|uniref:efflux RND transporter periplasmic adaptor subunit n=1 Tax=Fretibacterium sp. OH1220_COT-178 TaxID=2491047 RepID=UPI000F5F48B5|nr:HlyD family efflux transporter periplasmic adaptor subunit [Fretibacterium sp. OH1220_COT-178]RRD64093.1 HlyD family efflux transporter periplasmic adaptor subunit [Fretibacterium sp. OH1220_COT-178]